MRSLLILAVGALLAGCATTSASSGNHAAFTAWDAVGTLQANCSADPSLCARLQQAGVRYTRSGPFMPY